MPMNPRLLRPRATGFNPKSISGLMFWIDPSDAATVTLNGSAISAIADKSGNNRAFSNGTAARQPAVGTLNGRACMNMDATDRWLQSDFTITYTAQTVVCVCQPNAAVPLFARAYSQANATTETPTAGYIPLIRNSSASPLQMTSYTTNFLGPTSFTAGATTVFAARHSGAAFTVRANGTAGASQSHTLNIQFTRQRYGNGFSGADGFRGLFGDCLMWNRSLTDGELTAVERWLASKWGITLAQQVSNADAQDWINRVYANGGTVSATTASAVNTFCDAITNAGIRDRFYRLNLFCGNSDASLAAVRTPLYRGPSLAGTQYGNAIDTNNNFVQGDYAETGASGGLTGNGTSKYLDTGFAMNTLPSTTSGHASVYCPNRSSSTAYCGIVGVLQSAPSGFGISTDSTLYSTWGNHAFAANLANGHLVASRTSATSNIAYANAAVVATNSGSVAPTASSLAAAVFASRQSSSVSFFDPRRYAAYSIGTGLTGSDVTAFTNAMQAFQAALGRQV